MINTETISCRMRKPSASPRLLAFFVQKMSWLLLFAAPLEAQISPQKVMTQAIVEAHFADSTDFKKKIDSAFLWQTRAALLFYPELKTTKITFKVKKSRSPLSARPRIWSVFQRPRNRNYVIVISSKTLKWLEPILLKNLSFNAQIGVLGHELSHVADFQQRRGIWFIRHAALHSNKKYVDKFENSTDSRCIKHGLGYQLLAWSEEVRRNLKIEQWNGADSPDAIGRERYMSPASIRKQIDY